MKIAVTGATGLVGRFVIAELLASNHEVCALTRSTKVLEGFDISTESIRWHKGEMKDERVLAGLCEGCDALVHAAFSHVPGRFRGGEGRKPTQFWEQNFGGTVRCIEAARDAGLERIILFSSRAVFDGIEQYEAKVDDSNTPLPNTHYGLVKYASELLGTLYSDIAVCSLRPTGIYGLTWPRSDTKWWKLLSNQFRGSRESSVSSASRTEVHGQDVATAVHLLLEAEVDSVRGRSFNCSDIVVSESRIVEIAREILSSGSVAGIELADLPNPRNTMRCDALKSLGWKPGGNERLVATVSEILDLAGLRN